jgi:thioredoxin-like negative regulator of GroEL
MSVRTPRMAQLEAMLADEPNDPELRYFLAMEYLSAGDDATGTEKLRELTATTTYVPAFLQAGQLLNHLGNADEACAVLRKGIEAARQQRNDHALGEMQGLLDSIE